MEEFESVYLHSAAAVADYRPQTLAGKTEEQSRLCRWNSSVHRIFLRDVRHRPGRTLVIGLAAETENSCKMRARKLSAKQLDAIVCK